MNVNVNGKANTWIEIVCDTNLTCHTNASKKFRKFDENHEEKFIMENWLLKFRHYSGIRKKRISNVCRHHSFQEKFFQHSCVKCVKLCEQYIHRYRPEESLQCTNSKEKWWKYKHFRAMGRQISRPNLLVASYFPFFILSSFPFSRKQPFFISA